MIRLSFGSSPVLCQASIAFDRIRSSDFSKTCFVKRRGFAKIVEGEVVGKRNQGAISSIGSSIFDIRKGFFHSFRRHENESRTRRPIGKGADRRIDHRWKKALD